MIIDHTGKANHLRLKYSRRGILLHNLSCEIRLAW